MLSLGTNYTKVCGVCYYLNDIEKVVDFCKKKGYNYYFIKHIGVNDEIKGDAHKEHYHFIIESNSQHRFIINSLLSDTLKLNLLQKCDSVKAYLRYMLHLDYDDKEHYKISDIISNIDYDLIEAYIESVIVDKKEINKLNFAMLCEMILDKKLKSFQSVVRYCLINNIEYCISWTNTFVNLFKSIVNDKVV